MLRQLTGPENDLRRSHWQAAAATAARLAGRQRRWPRCRRIWWGLL
jgi:hypothetical protein